MARNTQQIELPENQIVEVVMKKQTTYKEYKKMIKKAKQKGWKIQAYQINFYADNLNNQIS